MPFGLKSASSIDPADWIAPGLNGHLGTAGGLVPNRYDALLRIHPPADTEHFRSAYRDLFASVAEMGQRHTTTPDRAWFAIWEGHGFDSVNSQIAHRGPLDDGAKLALERQRTALRDKNRRRTAEIRAALSLVPRFDLPHRRYYLVEGSVTDVAELRYPDGADWRNPDLFWPDDRRWFIAADVDFWSLYIGGDHDFITELAAGVPIRDEPITSDYPIEVEA